jgi:tyrosine-protein kinase Etk/Wzc
MKPEELNSSYPQQQDEEIDIKKIIYIILRHWYWFVLFGILGGGSAILYDKFSVPQYSVSCSILVPEKSTGLDLKDLFQGALPQASNKIYNQIEILRSYYTINQTLKRLDWRTSWSQHDFLVWRSRYLTEPFEVVEPEGFFNPPGISIYITPITFDNYKIEIASREKTLWQTKKILYSGESRVGQEFTYGNFRFTLQKKPAILPKIGEEYRFRFNDLNQFTISYQRRLKAAIKDKNSDIILCSINGDDPYREGNFLNELTKVYIQGKMALQNEAQQKSLEFINEQLSGISDSLSQASNKFADFRSRNQIIDIGSEGQMVMNNLKEIETQRSQYQMQLDYFQSLLNYLNTNVDYKNMVSPSVVGIQDANLNAMVLHLSELYNRRQVVSFSAKENNPTLILIDKELEQTRKSLIENVTNLISNTKKSITSFNQQKSTINQRLNKLPEKEQQLIGIQRQFDLTNEIYTFLRQKQAEISIALASSIPDVQIIDVARPETALPIGMARTMKIIIGFIIGIIFPMIFLFLRNFFDDTIRSQEDVEQNTLIPILGNIMHSPAKTDIAISENPRSNIAESFRGLRTNLQYMLKTKDSGVISVHSTSPGEGKSFITTNLATILAMNDKRVVVVGADLRKPRIHKIFGMDNEAGLSTWLINYHTLEEIILPTTIPNLSIIPSGPIPPNPAEILGKPEMSQLMTELRSRFDYIVIDNAPISLVTDGIIVSRLSDVNIFILRFGVSHKNQLKMINQYVDKQMVQDVAVVVNDIKTNSFGYSYYKYYQYEAYQNSYYTYEEGKKKKKRKKNS